MKSFSYTASFTIALIATAIPVASLAQQQDPAQVDSQQGSVFDANFNGTDKDELMSGGPLGRATAISDGARDKKQGFTPDFQISSPDGSIIVGTASISKSGPIQPTVRNDRKELRYKYGRKNFSAKLTVPFNNADNNSFINFRNIGNDVELEFDYSAYIVSGRTGINSDLLDDAITQQCITKFAAQHSDKSKIMTALETALINRGDKKKAATFIWDELEQGGALELEILSVLQYECKVASNSRFKNYEQFTESYSSNVTYVGLSGRAGLERFELLNQAAFALKNENRVGFELEGYFGKITASGDAAFRLSASFARAFDSDEAMEVCQPAMSGIEDCLTGILQPPEQKDKFFAGIEGRLILDRNAEGEPTMAIAPQVTYDTEDEEFLVEVPLYLQRTEEAGLDAGIEFNYSSERDDFAVGFFVGVPLGTLF